MTDVDATAPENLAELVARYPLPGGVPDAIMNKAELAEAFDVSVNAVDQMLRRGLPVEKIGSNGTAYEIKLSHAWAWRQHREDSEAATRAQARTSIAQLELHYAGLQPDALTDGLSVADRQAVAVAMVHHMKASEMRRSLVRVDEMAELIERVLGHVRDAVCALPDRAERELGITEAQAEGLTEICDLILTRAAEMIEDAELAERDETFDLKMAGAA